MIHHIHPRPRHTKPHGCGRVHSPRELALRGGVRDRCAYYGLTVNETREQTVFAMAMKARGESDHRIFAAVEQRAREISKSARGVYRYGDDHPKDAA